MNEDETFTPVERSPGRRQFLELVWAVVLAVLTGQAVSILLKFMRPMQTGRAFGGMVRVGKETDFPAGSVTRSLPGRCYMVSNKGQLTALWQRCTHLGCAVLWVEKDGQFRCQCHGSVYDRQGNPLSGPAPRPLDQFPVSVVGGEVWVDTAAPMEQPQHVSQRS